MEKILSEKIMSALLRKYYEEHYGIRNDDLFYEKPAKNVWMFLREGRIIVLSCHILNGNVSAKEISMHA